MIDLSTDLPDTVTVDGKSYLVKTDFREWLKFYFIINKGNATLKDLFYLFVDEIPQTDFSEAVLEFYSNPNTVPNFNDTSDEVSLDYMIDSEYIYASFMAVYGIDLFEVDMHWHKFKALLIGLPDDSKIKQIMAERLWKPSNKKPDDIARENKRAWSIPKEYDKETLEEINNFFG